MHRAHGGSAPATARFGSRSRAEREEAEHEELAPAATRARGAGQRAVAEAPDPVRTCFERDRDRILHAAAFRRLAGKTQVFVFPADHQRTRLTHALEVAQVATAIADALGLNRALTEAIALGHDCGHGPGGHASEDAFTPYLPEGYDHAVWGADVVLAPLNLCAETLDGVRNHSWSRPAPSTPEGEVVAWADRIAYVCHDFEDAVSAGIVAPTDLPDAGARALRRPAQRPDRRVHRRRRLGHHGHRHGVDDRPSWPRPWPRSGPSTTSASTCARPRWPRPRPSSACSGPWSSTSPPSPPCCPTRRRFRSRPAHPRRCGPRSPTSAA